MRNTRVTSIEQRLAVLTTLLVATVVVVGCEEGTSSGADGEGGADIGAASDAGFSADGTGDSGGETTSDVIDEVTGCLAPVFLQENVESPTTWEDRAAGDCVDYVIEDPLFVRDALTIAAGVRVAFGQGAGLRVEGSIGALTAVGTEDAPVFFVGRTAAPGLWESIVFATNNPVNRLEFAVIQHGGRGDSFGFSGSIDANVIVEDNGVASLVDCRFDDGAGDGLRLREGARVPEFARNQFAGNGGAAVRLRSNQIGFLDVESVYNPPDAPNAEPFIHVAESTIVTSQRWRPLDVPYRIFGKNYVVLDDASGELRIEPGVAIEFSEGAGIRVDEGALVAVGTPDSEIVFEGVTKTAGYWDSIVFASNNPRNEIAHASIAHGGKGDSFGFSGSIQALVVVEADAQATVRESSLSDSEAACFGGDGALTTANNALTNCE